MPRRTRTEPRFAGWTCRSRPRSLTLPWLLRVTSANASRYRAFMPLGSRRANFKMKYGLVGLMMLLLSSMGSQAQQQSLEMVVVQKYGWADVSDARKTLSPKERSLDGGVLASIGGLSVGNDGRLYVPDGIMHKIVVFNRDGSLSHVFGGNGDGPGELRLPVRLTLGQNDDVFVFDMQTNRISVYNSRGDFKTRFVLPGTSSVSLEWAAGVLWTDRSVAAGQPVLIGLDPTSGAVRDSLWVLSPQERDVVSHSHGPRLFSTGSVLYAASPIPGSWRVPTRPPQGPFGRPRFPQARGYTRTVGSMSGVRAATDGVTAFAVRSNGDAVMIYTHRTKLGERPGENVEEETVLEVIGRDGSSKGRMTIPKERVVHSMTVDGDDLLIGFTEEIPQVWRVRLRQKG